ncbi:hypothetical protein [Thalassoroseus pseudoceratinae]|uniref:hypothetical protein n=1 Tax=Thalassoroseus pseudoceratinae TaxID=2713176 RepID=UPI00141E9376|nr:hypothetical protein [Thalassoroseus pseudoceratinae]
MTPYRLTLIITACVCGIDPNATTFAQSEFILRVPGQNGLTSTAVVDESQIVIRDSQGQRFVYTRDRRMDTRNGEYLGYYSRGTRQALRWPVDSRGSMLIGDPAGNWRRSQQQIQPAGRRAGPRGNRQPAPRQSMTNNPPGLDQFYDPRQIDLRGLGSRPSNSQFPQRVEARRPIVDPRDRQTGRLPESKSALRRSLAEVAFLPRQRDTLDVGYIDDRGQYQLYRGWKDKWNQVSVPTRERLVPGAPLAMSTWNNDQSRAYTVATDGRLIGLDDRGQIEPLTKANVFEPGSHLLAHQSGANINGFSVDRKGRLWQLDFDNVQQHRLIDPQPNRFDPGVPLAYVNDGLGGQPELFGVDRNGSLVSYAQSGNRWSGPNVVGNGFPPGAPLTAMAYTDGGNRTVTYAAAVDTVGRMQLLSRQGRRWNARPIVQSGLAPNAPVSLVNTPNGLMLSSVDGRGEWRNWVQGANGWTAQQVASGFAVAAPIAVDPLSMTGFGIDATGRLLANTYGPQGWNSYLLLPGLDYTPRIHTRQLVAAAPLPPARVNFVNSGEEEMIMQLADLFAPGPPSRHKIPPRGSIPIDIPRDSGGVLREVYSVPTPAGWVEEVNEFSLAPQQRFTVVAWANRTTYSYIDPKGVSVLPDFDLKTAVSLGVFDLPPGEFLRDGETIDVLQVALAQRNPGAAQFFEYPQEQPEFIPREAPSDALPPSLRRQFELPRETPLRPLPEQPRSETRMTSPPLPTPLAPETEVPQRKSPQPVPERNENDPNDGPQLVPPLPN